MTGTGLDAIDHVVVEPAFIDFPFYGPENDYHPPAAPYTLDGPSNTLRGELLVYEVYQARLTNVEVITEVVDTETNEEQTYANAPGTPFQPSRAPTRSRPAPSRAGSSR